MLSKFFSCIRNDMVKADADSVAALIYAMRQQLSIKSVKQIDPGGTLGIFFEGDFEDKKIFIKSHQPNEMASKNLVKEIYFMDRLYKELFCVRNYELKINEANWYIMAMNFLTMCPQNYAPDIVRSLISSYGSALRQFDRHKINYGISEFEMAVRISCEELAKAQLIDTDTYIFAQRSLKNFNGYSEFKRGVCHGDLSNVNIVSVNDLYVALDWEDAMECVPDYDILYWFTFFSQRKYYGSMLFKDLNIKEEYGKDIMVMILMVKSYISYLNQTYKSNRLTIQDRLNEIIFM